MAVAFTAGCFLFEFLKTGYAPAGRLVRGCEMIIRLDNIPDEGLNVDESRPDTWLTNFPDLLAEDGISAAGPVKIRLNVVRTDEQVHVQGDIRMSVHTECARCLAEVIAEVEAPVDIVLVPTGPGRESEDAEDEGFGTYREEEIDLAEHLRGQLALYFPSKFLCKPNCKGLCPQCGADLNNEECSCKTEAVDPRWAALNKLKL